MNATILLFAKVPRPGEVMTRLTPFVEPEEAARLYTAFLRDTVRKIVSLEADVRLYVAPPLPQKEWLGVPTGVSVHAQEGEGLGARMDNAVRETLEAGADRVVLFGTDHPTFPPSFVRRALAALDEPDSIAIGPSEDGGYYLLGMNRHYPELFENMSYSHAEVFSETLSRVDETNASVTVLPTWYDVDRPEDLERLCAEVRDDPSTAPHSRRVLDRLDIESRF